MLHDNRQGLRRIKGKGKSWLVGDAGGQDQSRRIRPEDLFRLLRAGLLIRVQWVNPPSGANSKLGSIGGLEQPDWRPDEQFPAPGNLGPFDEDGDPEDGFDGEPACEPFPWDEPGLGAGALDDDYWEDIPPIHPEYDDPTESEEEANLAGPDESEYRTRRDPWPDWDPR